MQNYIVGLDIGSKTIKAAIGEASKDGKLLLIKVLKTPSDGMRKGVVDDTAEVMRSLSGILSEIKKIAKGGVRNIFLGVGSSDVKVQSSLGVVAVSRSDYEIYEDDIQRAIQGSQAINLPPNRMVLHSIVKEFIVDGVRDIRDPIGMIGNRLEVSSLIIDAFEPAVKNLTKCVETLGGGLSGLILSPLASARSVLSKNQKDLGVVLIDIGFGKTGMCVYEEGKLLHAAVFPVGSGNITNDLAIGLKTSVETAEVIKLSFGSALSREIGARESVDLSKIDPQAKGVVAKKFIAEVIEVRLAEIFEMVNNELKAINKSGRLPGGVVLVGGGAKLPGIADLAKQELKLASRVGVPDISSIDVGGGELSLQIEDPEFACPLGLLLWASEKQAESKKVQLRGHGFLKNIIRYFVP